MKLDKAFYLNKDVVFLAREFLGKVLCTAIDGQYCSGIITETEAYAGIRDRASHAWGDRRTKRTEPMYRKGGIAYVYLIYGMYSLFNIVTAPAGTPHAVLVRALKPLEGTDVMMKRRKADKLMGLSDGPGKLTVATGIHYSDTGEDLGGKRIWIEDRGIKVEQKKIITGPRVGIDYAGEDALLPYRFRLSDVGD
ncbi:MAG: DNA-3-methyladenine glycosylase [Bacteroidales bacterium]|jgi:DNA-3-methyladenine glycosylase|nr:DNA-3-methyladenine glycosylase [Bacteroidales bacterium]